MKNGARYLAMVACIFTSSSLFATTPALPFNGYYVGGGLGTSFAHADETVASTIDLSFDSMTFNSTSPFNLRTGMSQAALIGSLFGGYGHTWNKIYLGGELAVSNSDYKMTNSSSSGISRTVQSLVTISGGEKVATQASISPTQVSLSLRPGVLLTPSSLLYGRLGVTFASVDLYHQTVTTKVFSQPEITLIVPMSLQANKKIRRAVFQVGTGLEQAINEQWTIRLDYLYTNYGNINVATSSSLNADPFLITGSESTSVRINDQSLMMGISYHFK